LTRPGRGFIAVSQLESKERVLKKWADFSKILQRNYKTRPKVAIIGDLYVRDNDIFNQQLISVLEDYGAEVVTVPNNYVLRLSAIIHSHYLREDGRYLSLIRDRFLREMFEKFEKHYYQIAEEVLSEKFPTFDDSIIDTKV
jgi:predicted nucleotide-binding protein (sugar kinase/HSP70/actin superfamily)